jgi:hypothetical protein
MRNAEKKLVGKTVAKRPLEKLKRIWEDNIKWILTEFNWFRMLFSGGFL